MKSLCHTLSTTTLAALCGLVITTTHAGNWMAGMIEGKPEIKSILQLAFGPEGILLIADSKSAAVFAIARGDTAVGKGNEDEGGRINQRSPRCWGPADQVLMKSGREPISHNGFAVREARAGRVPVLIRAKAGGNWKRSG